MADQPREPEEEQEKEQLQPAEQPQEVPSGVSVTTAVSDVVASALEDMGRESLESTSAGARFPSVSAPPPTESQEETLQEHGEVPETPKDTPGPTVSDVVASALTEMGRESMESVSAGARFPSVSAPESQEGMPQEGDTSKVSGAPQDLEDATVTGAEEISEEEKAWDFQVSAITGGIIMKVLKELGKEDMPTVDPGARFPSDSALPPAESQEDLQVPAVTEAVMMNALRELGKEEMPSIDPGARFPSDPALPPAEAEASDTQQPPAIAKAVSKVTVKALQELSLEDMDSVGTGARFPSISGPAPTESEDEMLRRSRPSSATVGDTDALLRNLGRGVGHVDTESDEEDFHRDAASDAEQEDEIQSDLVVLDPDHPLMKRFQNRLKEHLLQQIEKAKLKKREVMDDLKRKKTSREDLGVRLYGMQQELAKQQANLEQLRDKHTVSAEKRRNQEDALSKLREKYKQYQAQVNQERKKNSELQTEVENLATRLFYMMNAKDDIRSDIAVMKRAAEKAEVEVAVAEMSKQRQDLHVNRLTEKAEQLRETIAMYEAQQAAQSEETLAAKQSLSEAKDEIDAILLEKKQLYQQWTSSLIGMKRRDEAHAAMQEALNLAKHQIKSLETEIGGYKRSIQKEEEKNETLTMVLNKVETNKTQTKKLIKQSIAKQDALKQRYATYSRTLHETEQAYQKAVNERNLRQSEITALRKKIEKEYDAKVELEDKIMKDIQQQLTANKAESYTVKITDKLRETKKRLEMEYSQVENDMARSSLQHTECTTRIRNLKKQLEELEAEIRSKNDLISRAEQDVFKRNAIIERKQTSIDQYNKKLEQLMNLGGGEELGPLEIQINNLNKQIEVAGQGITDIQQFWLRQQHELVRLTKQRDQQNEDVNNLRKQHTILSQKRLRIEGEIEEEEREQIQLDRSIRNMQSALTKLHTLLTKEKGIQENLEQGNILTENEFVQELKAAELESIQMQHKLDCLKEEKERLLNSLIEAERQIMLWEKKTQIAKETRSAVDSEVGQGEMRAMRAEIHRMEVRHGQLMKQQEQMMREMEQVVSRRDTIITRGEAQAKIDHKTPTKGAFQKKLNEIKKKIKQTQKDAAACDDDIRQLRENQADLGKNLEEKQVVVQQMQGTVDSLEGDVERLSDLKQRNLTELIARQTKVKHLQSLKDGKYTSLCKTGDAVDNEFQKQEERLHHMLNILDRLIQEFPHAQQALRRVAVTYGPEPE